MSQPFAMERLQGKSSNHPALAAAAVISHGDEISGRLSHGCAGRQGRTNCQGGALEILEENIGTNWVASKINNRRQTRSGRCLYNQAVLRGKKRILMHSCFHAVAISCA